MAELNPQILITAKDEASKVLKNLGDTAEKTGQTLGDKLKGNVVQLGAAFAAVTGVIATSIAAFDESQASVAQLNSVLQSTKSVAGITADEVLKLSSSLQQQTKFSDEAVTGAQSLLLTFTNIGKDIFPEATKIVLDMSQALGQDLKSSAIQLGKALQDPILGVTALRRVGVNFNEAQTETIRGLVESGKLFQAQTLILKELTTEFGGSAFAAGKTFGGQMIILKNNVNDLQETIGEGLVVALLQLTGGFEGANKAIANLNEFLKTHKDIVSGVSFALIAMAVAFGALLVAALAAAAGLSIAFVGAIAAVVAAVGFATGMIVTHWQKISDFLLEKNEAIISSVHEIENSWQNFKDFMIEKNEEIISTIQVLEESWQRFKDFVREKNEQMISDIHVLEKAWQKFKDFVLEKIEAIKSAINVLNNALQSVINFIVNLKSAIENFRPSINIGINLPDIEGAWRSLKERARKLGIPGFQVGGIVPGPIGSPQLVMAHGGEEVVPHRGAAGGTGGGVTFNVFLGLYAGSVIEKRTIAEELYQELVNVAGAQNKTVAQLLGS